MEIASVVLGIALAKLIKKEAVTQASELFMFPHSIFYSPDNKRSKENIASVVFEFADDIRTVRQNFSSKHF